MSRTQHPFDLVFPIARTRRPCHQVPIKMVSTVQTLLGRTAQQSIKSHLTVVQFKRRRQKKALSEFVPSLHFKSGTPNFSPSPTEWRSDSRRALRHNEETAPSRQPFKGEAAVIDASLSSRRALICMGLARVEQTAVILN